MGHPLSRLSVSNDVCTLTSLRIQFPYHSLTSNVCKRIYMYVEHATIHIPSGNAKGLGFSILRVQRSTKERRSSQSSLTPTLPLDLGTSLSPLRHDQDVQKKSYTESRRK